MTSDFQTMFDGAQGTSWTRIILHRRHACYDVNCGSRDSMRLQSEAILQFRALNCNSESVRSLLPLQPRETSLPNGIQTLDRISLHSRTVLRPTSTRFPKATDN